MPPKKVLLMYISEVSGHHSATKALEQALLLLEPQIEILNINSLNYTNPISEKIVNLIYMLIIKRIPRIWEYLYDNPQIVKITHHLKEFIHRFNAPKLDVLFSRFYPDCIVCTQAFPCGMVSDYKKVRKLKIPILGVLTDFTPHSYWLYEGVNFYVVACEEAKNRLIKKGIHSERICVLGIPIFPEFAQAHNPEQIIERLGLERGVPIVLIMGGGQGIGPIKELVLALDGLEGNLQILVVAGTNRQLFISLKNMVFEKKVIVFKYIENISELMRVSTLLITKPGGLTCAEALSKGLPMMVINPIPGQEANNTRFLSQKGIAIIADDEVDAAIKVKELLDTPERVEVMRRAALEAAHPQAAQSIAKLILRLCSRD